MESVFKYELDSIELEKIKEYCNSVDYCSIEQSIGWTELCYKSRNCYFYLIEDTEIKSFSKITERFKFAHITFGPVCCDKDLMINSINEIIKYYKKLGFWFLDIQMYYKSGFDTDYIEYALNKLHKIRYFFNSDNTKSSYEIDLGKGIEEIFSNMRGGHKRTIKKAIKLGITVDTVKDKTELDSFIEIYSKMCKARKIDAGELSPGNIHQINDYLTRYNKGQILIAKDNIGTVLGGVVLVYQGITVRGLKGTSDDDKKDLPISHYVLFEAIRESQKKGFRYFDFWGYNHFADESNHVFNINYFKTGFGGYCTFFAKKMNINLIPNGYYIYIFLLGIKDILAKLHLIKT
jgi:lipid II:glycine glycyltransferase (peptidoglycan interpeptide bridge formation enzyme)